MTKQITLQAGYNMISIDAAVSDVYIVQHTVSEKSLYYRLVLDKQ